VWDYSNPPKTSSVSSDTQPNTVRFVAGTCTSDVDIQYHCPSGNCPVKNLITPQAWMDNNRDGVTQYGDNGKWDEGIPAVFEVYQKQ